MEELWQVLQSHLHLLFVLSFSQPLSPFLLPCSFSLWGQPLLSTLWQTQWLANLPQMQLKSLFLCSRDIRYTCSSWVWVTAQWLPFSSKAVLSMSLTEYGFNTQRNEILMHLAKAGLSVCNGWLADPEELHTAEQRIWDLAGGALKKEFHMQVSHGVILGTSSVSLSSLLLLFAIFKLLGSYILSAVFSNSQGLLNAVLDLIFFQASCWNHRWWSGGLWILS